VDRFLAQDIEASRAVSLGDKLLEALNLMHVGIGLKREQLRSRNPHLTEAELEAKLDAWLARDE